MQVFLACYGAGLGVSGVARSKPDVLSRDEGLRVEEVLSTSERETSPEARVEANAVRVVTLHRAFIENVCTNALWQETRKGQKVGDPGEVVEHYRQASKR